MNRFELVYPMFAMVCLTVCVGFTMLAMRIRAARRRDVHLKYFKHLHGDAPEYMVKPARHFMNLFETPVLFYAVCITAMVTQTSDSVLLILAWVYFVFRVAHAAIHIGPNNVMARLAAFMMSVCTIFAMWILVVIRI